MQEDKVKITTFGDDAHKYIRDAVDIMEEAVGSTYGPGGRPMLIKKKYVDPILSTDGVTVARNIAGFGSRLKDPRTTDAAKDIYQASEKTNKTAGDGTTCTIVLLSEVYKSGRKIVANGVDAMHIKRQIDEARVKISDFVQSKSVECDADKLVQVATISGKDEALGKMVADLVWDVGADGAITLEYQNAPSVDVEKVTGYLFGSGFKNLANDVEFVEPLIFVSQKRLAAKGDIVPILEAAAQEQKQFVIVGDVSGAAFETLVWAISNQKADGLCIPPPAFGNDGHEYFEDIATYTGANIILESDSFKDVTKEHAGTVKRARISRDKAILFGDNKTGDQIADRIKTIDKELKADVSTSRKEVLDQRKAKLAGKVSIIKIGAATEMEREELFFRVEDAVEASKSALSSGIVAGGATTLLFASELKYSTEGFDAGAFRVFEPGFILEPFIREALQEPFRLLMKNAAYRADLKLDQTLKAGYGHGFDLKNMTDEPIDLIKAGVVDATKVVLQTVSNAFSVAAGLLSAGGSITEQEDEKAV